jgi:hypothetical protein
MPKVRQPKTIINEDDFINSADRIEIESYSLDPNAKRNYKKINVPFNEYEYNLLNDTAQKLGRTKLNFIRWAISEMSKSSTT